ncbi:MAG: DUF4855 domain-containing protein [Victivallaceae bacterium]|nr:DUF4855 domain-containing protein [Victivallaceae bacterium]
MSYPSLTDAGFHHCTLIYEQPPRNSDSFRHYVAKIVDGRPEPQWVFDAFLFLTHNVRGMNTEIGEITMDDFQAILEQYFAPGRNLDALDSAIEKITGELGALPPSKRKIIIVIPWLNPAVTNFGTLNGKPVSLATQRGRDTAVEWYVKQVKERFANRYKHLELWGFYWMRENISGTPSAVRAAADIIHRHDLKLLWIPYYLASGFDRWRDYGVDVAIMQSNYVFNCADTGGNARANRLTANAARCRKYGLGFEIELSSSYRLTPDQRHFFLRTLECGGAERLGYQQAPTAYYLGGALELYASPEVEMRRIYQSLCDYIAGRQIIEPRMDHWDIRRNGGALTAECILEQPIKSGNIDIFFNETGEAWHGVARLYADGRPVGWAARTNPNPDELEFQALTVPLDCGGRSATCLRLEISGGVPDISDIALEHNAEPVDHDRRFSEPLPEQLDGLETAITGGKSGLMRFIYGQHTEAVRIFTLETPERCDRIVISCANPADSAALLLAAEKEFCAASGCGALPEDTLVIPATVRGGKMIFDLPEAVVLQNFSLCLQFSGYTGTGAVELFRDGKRIAAAVSGRWHPGTLNNGGEYYDDGVVATTGVIPQNLNGMTGWSGGGVREFCIDLGSVKPAGTVMIGCFYSKLQKVALPERIEAAFSENGEDWSRRSSAKMPPENEKRNLLRLAPACVTADTPVRYIKLRVTAKAVRGALTLLKYICR